MTKKTVFIIGAGAGVEVGLPTGEQLKSKISKLLNFDFDTLDRQISGDQRIIEVYRGLGYKRSNLDISDYLNASRHVSNAMSMAISIDHFIDQHRNEKNVGLCGKLAIVSAILEAENNSAIYMNSDNGDEYRRKILKVNNTWLSDFFKLITMHCTQDDLADRFKNLSLIIFNYDRSVENYLFHALGLHYRFKSFDEINQLIRTINIYHPYGSLGKSYNNDPDPIAISFGQKVGADMLFALSEKIKTFTEALDPKQSDIAEIKQKVDSADNLCFLGFGFHKQNMELLSPSSFTSRNNNSVSCFATTHGISKSNQNIIRREISGLYKSQQSVELLESECNKFFSEFWKSLEF